MLKVPLSHNSLQIIFDILRLQIPCLIIWPPDTKFNLLRYMLGALALMYCTLAFIYCHEKIIIKYNIDNQFDFYLFDQSLAIISLVHLSF